MKDLFSIENAVVFNRREIAAIIADAQSVQDSNESDYTKEREKIIAFDHIVELVERWKNE